MAPTPKKPVNNTEAVDAYMASLDHPFKGEVQAVREIIRGVHPGITEEVKWNAPSFGYKEHLVTFNLHARQHVHLVFHNGAVLNDQGGLLKGDYVDRRMVYFSSMDEVTAARESLEAAIREWIDLMDAKES